MPADWVLDETGKPITDPARAGHGLLFPAGGYKGSGLAIVIGLLAGTLNGALFGRSVIDFNADDVSVTNTGHAMSALDVTRFMPAADFKRLVDAHIREIRASARLPGVEAIYLPGEQRQARIRERTAAGIPIPDKLVEQLDELARTLGAQELAALASTSETAGPQT
jgi:LDH2 family malate/lactate/ureidoglycolate dehydrogenase